MVALPRIIDELENLSSSGTIVRDQRIVVMVEHSTALMNC